MLIQDAVKVLNELMDAADHLNGLIRLSEDRRIGLAGAADMATTSELKIMFRKQSADYAAATAALQGLVTSIGGTPKFRGTIAGAAHRNWLKVKACFGDGDGVILMDMERSASEATVMLGKALPAGLPPPIHNAVKMLCQQAIRDYNAILERRPGQPGKHDAVMV